MRRGTPPTAGHGYGARATRPSRAVSGYSRYAPIANPVIRWGFCLFGRWTQERFYRNIAQRMYRLTQAAQHGRPLPAPTVRSDGLVLAPSVVRSHPAERLTR